MIRFFRNWHRRRAEDRILNVLARQHALRRWLTADDLEASSGLRNSRFWQTIDRMQREGLVVVQATMPPFHPNRQRMFRLTDAGENLWSRRCAS